jgi:hypothetical protein
MVTPPAYTVSMRWPHSYSQYEGRAGIRFSMTWTIEMTRIIERWVRGSGSNLRVELVEPQHRETNENRSGSHREALPGPLAARI